MDMIYTTALAEMGASLTTLVAIGEPLTKLCSDAIL